jgi:acyl-CoA oxidase
MDMMRPYYEDAKKYPELKSDFDYYEMTREEKMEHWIKRYNIVAKIDRERYYEKSPNHLFGVWTALYPGNTPLALHSSMFFFTIEMLGSPEQVADLLPKAKAMKILGCYAQTELGHGSNVSGLETTATLDTATDEWVLHSPTITATKMWPGSLGVMANYAIVYARCLIGDKDYGPMAFVAQIRSLDTHLPMDGVKVGDLGTKLGFNSVDNGWMSFDQYRIPRSGLMSRFIQVDAKGNFSVKGDMRILYNIMVQLRMMLIEMAVMTLKLALLIATRYAVCRR